MSSREIAELTGKRHADVMRDIRIMLAELHGEEGLSNFASSYINDQNKEQPCFNLPKRESLILVSGYNLKMRAAIIDRWQELEEQNPGQLKNFVRAWLQAWQPDRIRFSECASWEVSAVDLQRAWHRGRPLADRGSICMNKDN